MLPKTAARCISSACSPTGPFTATYSTSKRCLAALRLKDKLPGQESTSCSTAGTWASFRSRIRRTGSKPAQEPQGEQAGVDYRIASGGGRMKITMDRYEANWGMVELGWKTHVAGEGRRFLRLRRPSRPIRREERPHIDQDLPPFVIADEAGNAWDRFGTATRLCFSTFVETGPSR